MLYLFFSYTFVYFCIYFWLCWVLTATCRLSLAGVSNGLSFCTPQAAGPVGLQYLWLMAQHLRFPTLAPQLSNYGSWAHGSWAMARGDFPDQESSPCLPHWQGKSLSLSHQGSPALSYWEWGKSWKLSDLQGFLTLLKSFQRS